jgi:alpha-acetolactate decarboxylase
LSDDRRCGGHVFDYELADGDIELAPLHRLHLELPMNDEFERAEMSPNSGLDEQIRNSEG